MQTVQHSLQLEGHQIQEQQVQQLLLLTPVLQLHHPVHSQFPEALHVLLHALLLLEVHLQPQPSEEHLSQKGDTVVAPVGLRELLHEGETQVVVAVEVGGQLAEQQGLILGREVVIQHLDEHGAGHAHPVRLLLLIQFFDFNLQLVQQLDEFLAEHLELTHVELNEANCDCHHRVVGLSPQDRHALEDLALVVHLDPDLQVLEHLGDSGLWGV